MSKKILSILVLLSLFLNNFFFFISYGYETNWLSTPWTYEKANHLARKTLFWVDGENVKKLYQAGSAENAVNILFPSKSWPERTDFDNRLNSIMTSTWFSITNWDHMKSYYLVKRWEDPYQAKSKLFSIFEDIFSVYFWNEITYLDIENTHDMLYSHTLWSYKEMIKRNLYNNWNPGDYSLGKFLDLFNQTNPNYPNENYARELLQLFLMLEYIPTESEDNWDKRNYTEEDVNALAKIIMWFESDENTHIVTYNNSKNTNSKIKFLDWQLKQGDNFPFYDSETWEIDVQSLKTPINWNNWLPDNIIDYIFSKREYEISMFLADRLYRFYIAENPNRIELDKISTIIRQNNFDIYYTVKWLLADDMMYSDKSMNSIIYKTPLDLSIGTANIFWLDLKNVRIWSLVNLWWNPYFPQSIFGRDWFDDNKAFFTAYTMTQWVNESSYFINSLNLSNYIQDKIYITPYAWNDSEYQDILYSNKSELLNLRTWTWSWLSWVINLVDINIKDAQNNNLNILNSSIDFSDFSIKISETEKIEIIDWKLDYKNSTINIISWNHIKDNISKTINWSAKIDGFYLIQKDFTKESLISYLEDKLYLDRKLPQNVREKLINFLSVDNTWKSVIFDLNNNTYKNYYIKWLIQLMLIQPEYIMQSWYDLNKSIQNTNKTNFINNNSKLIVIKAWWGFDYLHWVIPKDEYDLYLEYRWEWAQTWTWIINLDDKYYLNSSLAPLKNLYDSWNLKLINRVWTPNHSRWHDTASQQITSLKSTYDIQNDWIIWHFIKNEDHSKTVVMWWYAPLEFRWWNYLNIWSNAYFNVTDATNTTFRNYKREQIKDILSTRDYPNDSENVFKNAVTINNVALNSLNNWGRAWAWSNMEQNFIFLESIFDSNISNIARMWATWWYDTHWNQKDYLNNNLDKVAKETVDFFNRVKDKQDITIVIFSEFWRTNKINSSMWTDHGQWWGMFIISNNKKLLQNLDKKVYWNMSFKNAKDNWLWVWIDYRTIYSWLMQFLYSQDISNALWAKYEIENYIDEAWPKIELLNKTYEHINNSRTRVRFKFDVKDTNFIPTQASYIKIQYWKDKDNMTLESQYNISRSMKVNNDYIDLYLNNIESKINYFYKITIFDNQYNETILEWSFVSPEIKNNSDILSQETDTRLIRYNNVKVWLNYSLETQTSSWILLWDKIENKVISWENWIILNTSSWTYINNLFSTSTGSTWNGWFILPQEINKNLFLSNNAKFWNENLSKVNIEKIIKVWADELWVWMNLNKDVEINIPLANSNKNYTILSSEDWINWSKIANNRISKSWNYLNLKIDHFTYFAVVESDNSWSVIINNPPVIIDDNWNNWGNNWGNNWNNNSWNVEQTTKNYSWWGWVRLVIDKCPYWDFSPSYYDNSCWVDPDWYLAKMWVEKSESYRLEQQIEKTRLEEEIKANNYDINNNLNNSNNENQLIWLIKDKISYINVGNYQIIQIKDSKLNENFKKVWNLIINQKISNEYKTKLITNLNDIIVYSSVYKLDKVDAATKNSALKKLNETTRDFGINFRNSKKKITTINNNTEPTNNNVIVKETTIQKQEVKDLNDNTKLKKLQYRIKTENIYLKWDPYWKTDVWLLKSGDIVEQITQLHEKWFFKIKVISSNTTKIWTEGYIFIKHLSK